MKKKNKRSTRPNTHYLELENLSIFQLILDALRILNDREADSLAYSLKLFEDGSGTLLYNGRIKELFVTRFDLLEWASQVCKYGSYKEEK